MILGIAILGAVSTAATAAGTAGAEKETETGSTAETEMEIETGNALGTEMDFKLSEETLLCLIQMSLGRRRHHSTGLRRKMKWRNSTITE